MSIYPLYAMNPYVFMGNYASGGWGYSPYPEDITLDFTVKDDGPVFEDSVSKKDKDQLSCHSHGYLSRMQYAKENGCNRLVVCWNHYGVQYPCFVKEILVANSKLQIPFRDVELHIDKSLTDSMLYELVVLPTNITTVNLHATSFEGLDEVADIIHIAKFNLTLTIDMSTYFASFSIEEIVKICMDKYHANRVILNSMSLYHHNNTDSARREYYEKNGLSEHDVNVLEMHRYREKELGALLYRRVQINQPSFGVFCSTYPSLTDSMLSVYTSDTMKQRMILTPDEKLYSNWDLSESLIF